MSKRRECIENYKVVTEITDKEMDMIQDIMGGDEFYSIIAEMMEKHYDLNITSP
ncbi:hypothetical protein [Bacillus pumilus]|uniref:hypothetical protein n=1 Tax=Bacillus pumilus TaxID=1408 RepID=UPI00164359DD|nr:hypothetical protein [Bacillus pumilus]